MEAIGAAASIISLLQMLGTLRSGVQFLFRYHDAPSDFCRLSELIETLTAKLHLLKTVESWAIACEPSLAESESSILESLLAAKEDILYVRDICLDWVKGKRSMVKRLKWAIRDGDNIWNNLASRLQGAQSLLAITIQIIHLSVYPCA
jgi:hypothetical protein